MTLTRTGLIVGATTIALGLAAGAYTFAQNPDGPRGSFGDRRGGRGGPGGFDGPMAMLAPRMAERLGLSEAQRDQIRSIVDSRREDMRGLGEKARAAREALQEAVTAEVMDEGLIRARAADLATIESDLVVARARLRSEVFQVLTPDQQAQAREAQKQMQQRRSERRDRMPRRQAPPAQ
jgi:protein CpxP